jgi:hypothetical protein
VLCGQHCSKRADQDVAVTARQSAETDMVWGLNPGPLLFVEHKDFVWGLIASMYLGNVVGLVLVLTTLPIFASILRVPFAAVAPMIVASCAIGAYAIQNAMFDIWLMLGFGVVGYVFKEIKIPLAPFTLALVLGNRAEDALGLSMIGSGGDMKVFLVERPGRFDHHAGDPAAVLAGDRQGARQSGAVVAAGEDGRLTAFCKEIKRLIGTSCSS